MSAEGVQFNQGGRGRGHYQGRGRGHYQGRGRGQGGRGPHNQGGYVHFDNLNSGYQFNPRRNFIPPLPQGFYKFLNEQFDMKVQGKEELKYPVLNIHRSYIIKMFKNNSIISRELLGSIKPGDDDKSQFHFKKVYCSPNRILNDGLYIEFQRFINDVV